MNWQTWKAQETAVLLLLEDEDEILLIHKKRGLGKGKINFPGGRVEAGETWAEAAVRETREETGLTPQTLWRVATLRFQFLSGYALEAVVFRARGWKGQLTACEEADPFWHPRSQLPWQRMWADDALWIPPVLLGRQVEARFLFEDEAMRQAELSVLERPTEASIG